MTDTRPRPHTVLFELLYTSDLLSRLYRFIRVSLPQVTNAVQGSVQGFRVRHLDILLVGIFEPRGALLRLQSQASGSLNDVERLEPT